MSRLSTRFPSVPWLTAALALLLSACATTDLYMTPVVQVHPGHEMQAPAAWTAEQTTLTVMTFNVAHGRGTGFHQLLQGSERTVANLESIAGLLQDRQPDVVAFQEIDGPSFWSGRFNHLDYLVGNSPHRYSVQASHVDGLGLAYGTALMSRLTLSDPLAVTFDPSLSPVPKGFVVSTIHWPGSERLAVDVVSVHLDFMSRDVRRAQADELLAVLEARANPVILMGDFNTHWQRPDSVLHHLADRLQLRAYQPDSRELVTFPALGERLDWILVSRALAFQSHVIEGDGLSDHRAVVAELALVDDGRVAALSAAR